MTTFNISLILTYSELYKVLNWLFENCGSDWQNVEYEGRYDTSWRVRTIDEWSKFFHRFENDYIMRYDDNESAGITFAIKDKDKAMQLKLKWS